MTTQTLAAMPQADANLFTRVTTILDTARERVVRSVNQEAIAAYWLIGREIVEALQGGEARASYGDRVIADLALRLTERYGAGFNKRNLEYFRRFYLVFKSNTSQIAHPLGSQSLQKNKASNEERSLTLIANPAGAQSVTDRKSVV